MEIAATLLTNLASTFGGTAGAAGAAGTAATAGSSLFSGSSLLSVLQGTATALSVVGAIRAGQAQADAANAQARDADLQSQLEQNQGIERRNQLKRAMLENLGERDVAYAASGVDLSFGTPATARDQAVADANYQLSVDRETEEVRRQRLLGRAAGFRAQADEARSAGVIKALGAGIGGTADILRRR